MLYIPQTTLTKKSSIITWRWILTAYLKELKMGKYYYSIIVWYQRFLWALSTAGIKKCVQTHEKYFDGWLSLQPGARSNGRLLSCSATSRKSKLEKKTRYCRHDDFKYLTWFTIQPKSAAEIGWRLVHLNFKNKLRNSKSHWLTSKHEIRPCDLS